MTGPPAGTRETTTAGGAEVHRVRLDGCRPTPLAGYLKALGVLRLVAEQEDEGALGSWRDDRFVLESRLNDAALRTFFLERYRPTPILAPWNGGSGFYPKDYTNALEAIYRGKAVRFEPIWKAVGTIRTVLADLGIEEKPTSAEKDRLLQCLRSELPASAVEWLDAAVLMTQAKTLYPPLLGTGGNDGRLEFTNNFLQWLVGLFDPGAGTPDEGAGALLDNALFYQPVPALTGGAIGQFAPSDAGGPNRSTGYEAGALMNPWDFVLMLEGAVLFAARATRRLESGDEAHLSAPFTVRATGAGSGSIDLSDEGPSRGEIWMPLWNRPTSLREIEALLGEGRATMGRRPAREGLDFARAVASLGVTRGIDAFQRYGFLQRYGRTYLATPLNRVAVREKPAAGLLDPLDRGGWRRQFRAATPARRASLTRRLDDSLFGMVLGSDQDAVRAQRALAVLGEIELYLATKPAIRERCPPVPRLSHAWIEAADDGSPEYRIAAALAALGPPPMVTHLAPVDAARPGRWADDAARAGRDVVWGGGSLEANLERAARRRLIAGIQDQGGAFPLSGPLSVPLWMVGEWLADRLDTDRIQRLFQGLCLCTFDHRGSSHRQEGRGPRPSAPAPIPAAYRVLKPLFTARSQLARLGFGTTENHRRPPLPLKLVRDLGSNRTGPAVEASRRILEGSDTGLRVPGHVLARADHGDGGVGVPGPRLLAALLLPIADRSLRSLLMPFATTQPDLHMEE